MAVVDYLQPQIIGFDRIGNTSGPIFGGLSPESVGR